MSWVWLSPQQVEFGGVADADDGAQRTVWLHADPYALLGVPFDTDRNSLRRAYRRLARVHHPDTGNPTGTFDELQSAFRAALGDDGAVVSIEPAEGVWWSFTGFVSPVTSRLPGHGAVVGLTFELDDLDAVPLREPEELVHITYAGEVLPLRIRYSRSAAALPVIRAKLASLLESAVLVLLCLTLIPFLAIALSIESYFLADGNVILFWAALIGTVGLGYGSLAAIFATTGRPPPYPRRAVARLRGKLADRLALPRGPS
jgi:hypothetical protein